jgi:superfamily II DNA/RNA helicase
MTAPLVRVRTVYSRTPTNDRDIHFVSATAPPVDVKWNAWRDMGNPDTITVTVEPGNQLMEARP